MIEPIRIVLSGIPVAGQRPRFRQIHKRDGSSFVGTYNPAHMQKWQTAFRLKAQEAMGADAVPLAGPLLIEFSVYLPIPQSMPKKNLEAAMNGMLRPLTRPDLDNYIKQIDALNGVVWNDDSQIVSIVASKWFSDRPRVELLVRELNPLPIRNEQTPLFAGRDE